MQPKQPLNPQLEEIKTQFDAASQKADSIVESLSFDQLKMRPQPDEWSIAECLVHLNLSSEAEINVLNDAYERMSAKRMYSEKQFTLNNDGKRKI